MISPTRVAILGATGSIGTQTLSVIRDLRRAGHPLEVVAVAGGRDVEALVAFAREFAVAWVGVAGSAEADRVKGLLSPGVTVVYGSDGLAQLAALPDVDLVVNAVVGAVGLAPTLSALDAGKRLALANKESLVIGADLVKGTGRGVGGIVPVDSEHAALYQLLSGVPRSDVERVWITASGGPFRERAPADLAHVTPAEAVAHPVWPMGRRISVDSATLANKAFEVIEAHHLFSLPWDRVGVLLHPQAQVHALVEMVDGTVIAQLAPPDMRIPIQAALTHPERCSSPAAPLSLARLDLSFRELQPGRYPAFDAVLAAGMAGGTAPAVANAADEVLVDAFLEGRIPFPAIGDALAAVLSSHAPTPVRSRADVASADGWARERAGEEVARRAQGG